MAAFAVHTAHAQSANEKNAPQKQAKADQAKPAQTSGSTQAREETAHNDKNSSPKPAEEQKEDKKWGIQVVTGEKWYQVSIKLVM